MTEDKVALVDPIGKAGDGGFVGDLLAFAAVEGLTGAGKGERTAARLDTRDGYRDRAWDTRLGRIGPRVPKLRRGSCFPGFPEPRRTAERALAAVIREARVQGVSTRSVDELAQAMGLAGVSESEVGRVCAEIDGRVQAFLGRPIEGSWPHPRIDATYPKVREGGRIVATAVMIAIAVTPTAGARCSARRPARPRPRRSGPRSRARWSTAARAA